MQRGYKLLISGTVIFVVGIILIWITFNILNQQSFSINSSIDIIAPNNSILKTIEVNTYKKLGISLNFQPSDILLNIQVIQQSSLSKILDHNFTSKFFTTLTPSKHDIDKVLITNLGSKTVSANTVMGNIEFFDANGQPKVSSSTMAIAGPSLLFIGVIVLIVGGILLIIDRIRGRKRK